MFENNKQKKSFSVSDSIVYFYFYLIFLFSLLRRFYDWVYTHMYWSRYIYTEIWDTDNNIFIVIHNSFRVLLFSAVSVAFVLRNIIYYIKLKDTEFFFQSLQLRQRLNFKRNTHFVRRIILFLMAYNNNIIYYTNIIPAANSIGRCISSISIYNIYTADSECDGASKIYCQIIRLIYRLSWVDNKIPYFTTIPKTYFSLKTNIGYNIVNVYRWRRHRLIDHFLKGIWWSSIILLYSYSKHI